MTGAGAFLIWCPFPDEAEARDAAGVLLDEGLIACANLVPGMISLYVWEAARGEAGEVGLLAKTHHTLGPAAITRLEQLHSYQTPAIVGWQTDHAAPATLAWLAGLADSGSA